MKNEQYKEAVNSLARHIQDAYAIVVGAASEMSVAAGFRHFYEILQTILVILRKNIDIVIRLMDFIIGNNVMKK